MPNTEARIGVLDTLTGYHLRRAYGVFAADFRVAVEGTGLRQVLFGILSVVSRHPGINQGAVGRLLGIKRANMVTLINELLERGLVNRIVDPGDRRALALTLTREGSDLLDEGLRLIRSHEERLLAKFGEQDRKTLVRLLRRIEPPRVESD